jgi:hypothetical protein
MDIASIGFEVDRRSLKKGQSDLESFGKPGGRTAGHMMSFSGVTTKVIGSVPLTAGAALKGTSYG